MSFVEYVLLIRKNGHGPDGMVIGHQRHAAEASARAKRFHSELLHFFDVVVADQHGLARSYDVFGEVITRGPAALGHAHPGDYFEMKPHFVADRIELPDIKIFDIEEPPQFFPNFAEQIFFVERGAQRAPNLIQHVQFFGAPRSLLHQVAVLDSHANLVAQGEEQPVFGGSEPPAIGSAQQQNAEGLFFRLQTDGYDAAKALRERQLAETPDRLLALESRHRFGILQVAEAEQSTQ